jgi:hypothetical protein
MTPSAVIEKAKKVSQCKDMAKTANLSAIPKAETQNATKPGNKRLLFTLGSNFLR